MAQKRWILMDRNTEQYVRALELSPRELGAGMEGCQVVKRRLEGGLSDGVDLLQLKTPRLAVDVLPTRGMGIWKVSIDGETWGWESPVRGPVHPRWVPWMEPSGLGWLDGFDELLVRCGLESNGAPEWDPETGRLRYPLHGRIANRPAHYLSVEATGKSLAVYGVVDETRFHFQKLRLESRLEADLTTCRLAIHDRITNLSDVPAQAQLLYHANFGPPVLDAGARVVAPARRVVPRNARAAEGIASWDHYTGPTPGFQEQVYFLQLHSDPSGWTGVLLKNAHGTRGVQLWYDSRTLPWFTLWKNTAGRADGYVTGLEPGTNFPNPRSFEGGHGRVVSLPPGQSVEFHLELIFLPDATAVQEAEARLEPLRAGEPEVLSKPDPQWCAP